MYTSIIDSLLTMRSFLERQTELRSGWRKKVAQLFCKPFKWGTDLAMYLFLCKYKEKMLGSIRSLDRESSFVVSLTSFPKRMDTLWMMLWSVWHQTTKPSKVILALTKEEYPMGKSSLPNSVKAFLEKGLEIVFTDENLKPHNKYFYALSNVADKLVITADDDFIYYRDTFERLLALHRQYPMCVCANRVQKAQCDEDTFLTYESWPLIHKSDNGFDLVALGYACVLYPINFRPSSLFKVDDIKQLCLHADDLWLKANEIMEHIDVVKGTYYPYPFEIPRSQSIALHYSNDNPVSPQNDVQWGRLVEKFNITTQICREHGKQKHT